MKSNAIFTSLIFLCLGHCSVFSQNAESPLRIFGYFQNQFTQQGSARRDRETNTFLVQQLNLFFQKNLSKNWAAFVNFEVLNSFSSSRNTGAISLGFHFTFMVTNVISSSSGRPFAHSSPAFSRCFMTSGVDFRPHSSTSLGTVG